MHIERPQKTKQTKDYRMKEEREIDSDQRRGVRVTLQKRYPLNGVLKNE